MGKVIDFTQKEIDFALKSTAKNNSEFSKEYIAAFGVPDSYTRPVSLFYSKKKIQQKQNEKFKKEAHEKIVELAKNNQKTGSGEKGGTHIDETVSLETSMVTLNNTLKRIERILLDDISPTQRLLRDRLNSLHQRKN